MRKHIILDTDMGPDCDDAGALALLHILAEKHPTTYLAMTNCTSNRYACGTIDAINRWYKHAEVPIGTYEERGFLEDGPSLVYSKPVAERYENAYTPPKDIPGALTVLKEALRRAEDGSVTIIAIGPLNNLARLIEDSEGYQLVQTKVKELVSMAVGLEKVEWNVEMDIPAAQKVVDMWPTPIVFTPAETGGPIITGRSFDPMVDDHPVRLAYRLFNRGDEKKGRPSWDLTAVWYALAGCEPFFSLTPPVTMTIDDSGMSHYSEHPEGSIRFLLNKIPPEDIAQQIDRLWK